VGNRSIDFRGETRKSAKILKVLTLAPQNFRCAALSHINVAIPASHHMRAVRAGGLWLRTTTRAAGPTSGALFGCLSNPLCRIETSRGNNHRSCLAAPLCKLSCQPLATDHEGPDQAQPRPRQPPVARAAATNVGHRGGQGGRPLQSGNFQDLTRVDCRIS